MTASLSLRISLHLHLPRAAILKAARSLAGYNFP